MLSDIVPAEQPKANVKLQPCNTDMSTYSLFKSAMPNRNSLLSQKVCHWGPHTEWLTLILAN